MASGFLYLVAPRMDALAIHVDGVTAEIAARLYELDMMRRMIRESDERYGKKPPAPPADTIELSTNINTAHQAANRMLGDDLRLLVFQRSALSYKLPPRHISKTTAIASLPIPASALTKDDPIDPKYCDSKAFRRFAQRHCRPQFGPPSGLFE